MKLTALLTITMMLALVTGCSSVKYGDPTDEETVNIDYGVTDRQRIADTMVQSLIDSPALGYLPHSGKDQDLRVIVYMGGVQNRTSEHIDTSGITDSIRTALRGVLLHHLEQRLQDLGAHRPGTSGLMFPPEPDLDTPATIPDAPGIDFFLSLRSPYTAIVAQRVFRLGEHTGAPVRLRYVLPMVMRGLPVPREKRLYIMHDAAREAHLRGVPFGRINDPLGRPTERGMALIPLAERMGQGQAYVGSFLRGVWSEGIDAGSDRGLRRIAERAGLAWSDARDALHDETWRALAEANRTEMFALGLWGVPSLRVGDTAVWGQDRLWAVQQAVLATRGARDTPAAMPVHA